jgi:hypothetical protein
MPDWRGPKVRFEKYFGRFDCQQKTFQREKKKEKKRDETRVESLTHLVFSEEIRIDDRIILRTGGEGRLLIPSL